MNREEIIQSLRACANGPECSECSVGLECGCMDNLMRMAADMLEADSKPQKTADEMFRELGYKKVFRPEGYLTLYQRYCDLPKKTRLVGVSNEGHIEAWWDDDEKGRGDYDFFDVPEIRAACKLLDEMEDQP